jgi:tRNA nucleotidyltransferase/poly(A) polymerase
MTKLTNAGIKAIPSGILHGTISAVFSEHQLTPCFSEKLQIQLTTFRKPGLRASHESSSTIEEDLSGRDFTINALAYEVTSQRLIDPFSGLNDIRGNMVRAVISPQERFNEDPQRIMRMVRFGPAAGRAVEASTLLEAAKFTTRLTEISIERIRDEFFKILLSDYPSQGIRLLKELGILDWLVPEIIPSYNLEQNEFHHEDVFEHTLTVVDHSSKDLHVRLAAFFHDLGKPFTLSTGDDGRRHFYLHEQKSAEIAREVMSRLKCSNADIQEVMLLVAYHMRPIDCGAPGARRLIRDLGSSYDRWRELKIADSPPVMAEDEFRKMLSEFDELITAERARNFTSPYSKLAITGNDILALGVPAGPEVGQLLKALEE